VKELSGHVFALPDFAQKLERIYAVFNNKYPGVETLKVSAYEKKLPGLN